MIRKSTSGSDAESSKVKPGKRLAGTIAKGFRHKIEMSVEDESRPGGCNWITLDVRIMEPAAWKRLDARDETPRPKDGLRRLEWSAVELEGGMVLAMRSITKGLSSTRGTEPEPGRAAKLRRLRSIIFEALEAHRDEFEGVSVEIGGHGEATFHVELDAETHRFAADIDLTVNENDR